MCYYYAVPLISEIIFFNLFNRCICPLGYTGTFCEIDIDNCIGNQCSEYGFCQDHLHNYSCICMVGYGGPFCEVEINECSSSPCKNGAICMNLIGNFSCHCAEGFKGKFYWKALYCNSISTMFIRPFYKKYVYICMSIHLHVFYL